MKTLLLKFLASKVIKGKLTWTGVVVVASPILSYFLGFDVGPDLSKLIEGLGMAIVAAGHARSQYQAKHGN